ncbi:DpnD/PcfM family protein [Christensenella tenuis]|uniref:DpnD/PcfM family protein n=1 Tax=Christensenella tenuis TaxID=2763033 RepID=A0ABR7EG78_9FIRM|nr:DpnD/PcfM family protein [Christensenella tenuis]MBC5648746.1 DpnD/PcfM family protein [Christensenella tenuis]
MKKPYRVTITETLSMTVKVAAADRREAEQLVSDQWHRGEYILDADHFTGVEFHGQRAHKKLSREDAR